MDTLLAALPIVVVLVLMIGLKWSAIWAGATAAAIAVLIALTAFDFGVDAPFGPTEGVLGVLVSAAWTALTVMLIIGPALGVHHLQQKTGATAEQTRMMLDTAMDKARAQGQEWAEETKAQAAEWAKEAQAKGKEWAREIAEKSGATAEQAKEVLSDVAEKIRSQGAELKEKAKDWEAPVLKNYVRRDQVRRMIQEELDAALKERDR